MTPSRPYLIRALYEWIVDNEMTPHLLVDAKYPDCVVPIQFVENGKIVLNVGPSAVQGLIMDNDAIAFSARFSGTAMQISPSTHGRTVVAWCSPRRRAMSRRRRRRNRARAARNLHCAW